MGRAAAAVSRAACHLPPATCRLLLGTTCLWVPLSPTVRHCPHAKLWLPCSLVCCTDPLPADTMPLLLRRPSGCGTGAGATPRRPMSGPQCRTLWDVSCCAGCCRCLGARCWHGAVVTMLQMWIQLACSSSSSSGCSSSSSSSSSNPSVLLGAGCMKSREWRDLAVHQLLCSHRLQTSS